MRRRLFFKVFAPLLTVLLTVLGTAACVSGPAGSGDGSAANGSARPVMGGSVLETDVGNPEPAMPAPGAPATDMASTEEMQPRVLKGDDSSVRLVGHWDTVRDLVLSEDGNWAVSGGDDRTVRLWNLVAKKPQWRWTGHGQSIETTAISKDGRQVASGALDGSIRLWSATTGQELRRFVLKGTTPTATVFDGSGAVLYVGAKDGTITAFQTSTGKVLRKLSGHKGRINALSMSADQRLLASGGDDSQVVVWNFATRKRRRFLGARGWVSSIQFSADGTRLVAGSADRQAHLWSVRDGKEMGQLTGHLGPVQRVLFAAGDRLIVTGGGSKGMTPDVRRDDFTVTVFDALSLKEITRFQGHNGPISDLKSMPDGGTVVSAGLDESIHLWKLPEVTAP